MKEPVPNTTPGLIRVTEVTEEKTAAAAMDGDAEQRKRLLLFIPLSWRPDSSSSSLTPFKELHEQGKTTVSLSLSVFDAATLRAEGAAGKPRKSSEEGELLERKEKEPERERASGHQERRAAPRRAMPCVPLQPGAVTTTTAAAAAAFDL
ncbi:hypothetical protein INR49_017876 [Caranx melampygus]|nr:hypothetical protein INR49_017876 [Caranx melampygus]